MQLHVEEIQRESYIPFLTVMWPYGGEVVPTAAVQVSTYDRNTVADATEVLFSYFDNQIDWQGKTVLLKVNLLSPKPPERAVTTHPEVVRASAEACLRRGAVVWIGDSAGGMGPGGSRTAQALEVCGIQGAAAGLDAVVKNFDQEGVQVFENPRGTGYKDIHLSDSVIAADIVISLAKLKTHSYTLYTGAVKNMYGCVPGRRKALLHGVAPSVHAFSEYLVDVFSLARPHLAIVDGIVAMEGEGPSAGRPKPVGGLFAGDDAVALDTKLCHLIGLDPRRVHMLPIAQRRGLGKMGTGEEPIGPWDALVPQSFSIPQRQVPMPGFLRPVFAKALQGYPEIIQDRCIRCEICLRSCPVQTILQRQDGRIEVDQSGCIQCYCCHELCPEQAVSIRTPVLGRLLNRLGL